MMITIRNQSEIDALPDPYRSTDRFNGDWSDRDQFQNAIEFRGRDALFRDRTFAGHEQRGAMLKLQSVSGSARVVGCRFNDIGTAFFEPNGDTSNEWITTQCIAGHVDGDVALIGNTFERCCLTARRWSHCIYVSGRDVTVVCNEFIGCGNPMALGKVGTEYVYVAENEVIHPAPTIDPNRRVRPGYFMALVAGVKTDVTENTLTGVMSCAYTGNADPAFHHIDYNDYSGLRLAGPYFGVSGGGFVDWPTWQVMGFDQHSKGPQI